MTYDQADLLLDILINQSKFLLWLQVGITGQLGFITYLLIRIRNKQ